MTDIQVDELQIEAAVRALRTLGTESFTSRPDDAAEATGHAGLRDAAAIVGAAHRRAVDGIAAEARSLADALEQSASRLQGIDRALAAERGRAPLGGGSGGW